VCRYYWHSAGSLSWPFPVLKYEYIFQIKYTEAIFSNSTRKLLRFKIIRTPIALKNEFIVSFSFSAHFWFPMIRLLGIRTDWSAAVQRFRLWTARSTGGSRRSSITLFALHTCSQVSYNLQLAAWRSG